MDKVVSVLSNYAYRHAGKHRLTYESYYYVFSILLETLAGLITGTGIAIWLGIPVEAAIFIFTFFLLRSYAGGFHFASFKKCYPASTGILAGAFLLIKYEWISGRRSAVILLVSTVMLFFLKPPEINTRSVDEKENIWFKKRLKHSLWIILIFYVAAVRSGYLRYAAAISTAVALVNLLMLIGIWKNG